MTTIDDAKLEAFVGQVLTDAGGALGLLGAYVGDRLGLYEALHAGPATPAEIAERSGTNERMVREWALAQAAGGYLTYDAETGSFTLPPEQWMVLANEDSPVLLAGFIQSVAAVARGTDKILEATRTGKGLAWGDHHHELFTGTERFFRPGYQAHLTTEWIPAFDGLEAKLTAGAKVADVGCGHGASTIIMAKAYPRSTFTGFDYHRPSIERARKLAAEEGVADRVTFEVSDATTFPGSGYDLVTYFDCLHDMGDPQGAVTHTRGTLAPGGTVLLVEPAAKDRPEENMNLVGRLFYGASSMICTPSSLDAGGPALGAQAGPARLKSLFDTAGFSTFRAAAETPFNIIFEARV